MYDALVPRWEAEGIEVTLYTMRWWTTPPDGRRLRALIPRLEMYSGSRRSIRQGVFFALGTIQLLVRPFDVIVADHMPYLHLFPLRVVAWVRGVRLVVPWHEIWGRSYWIRYMGGMGRLGATIERWAARLPDLNIAVSATVAAQLDSLGVAEDRIELIKHGLDRGALTATSPASDAPELLCVGRLSPHKGIHLALQALVILLGEGRDVHLGIIGDGAQRAELEALAHELDLRDHVRWYGEFDELSDVWSVIASARVLVFPSEREGFGLTVAEAQALGTAVVTSDHPHNLAKDLVTDGSTGSVVPAGDHTALATACGAWLDSMTSREEITSLFWQAHPELDWNTTSKRWLEAIDPG